MKNYSITIIDQNHTLSLEQICRAVHADNELIIQFIDYHIIQPKGSSQETWQFDHVCLRRARLARNFYYDLEVNLAGIGLLLDMLEKIEALETRERS